MRECEFKVNEASETINEPKSKTEALSLIRSGLEHYILLLETALSLSISFCCEYSKSSI